jgi:hypothetical protein
VYLNGGQSRGTRYFLAPVYGSRLYGPRQYGALSGDLFSQASVGIMPRRARSASRSRSPRRPRSRARHGAPSSSTCDARSHPRKFPSVGSQRHSSRVLRGKPRGSITAELLTGPPVRYVREARSLSPLPPPHMPLEELSASPPPHMPREVLSGRNAKQRGIERSRLRAARRAAGRSPPRVVSRIYVPPPVCNRAGFPWGESSP